MTTTQSIFKIRTATQYNEDAERLPRAEEYDITFTQRDTEAPLEMRSDAHRYKGIIVTMPDGKMHAVNVPKKGYHLVQHKDAFAPVIEGLTLAGVTDWNYTIVADHKHAVLNVFANPKADWYDGVSIGFSVKNSMTSESVLQYGFQLDKAKQSVEIVGYRQVCSNGMLMRVPLDQADIIRPEIRRELNNLWSEQCRIKHTASAEAKIASMQFVTEALALLQGPVEAMIKRSQEWRPSIEQMEELILNHIGKRYQSRIMERFADEPGDSLWDLYNAATYFASHDEDLRLVAREGIITRAADLLVTPFTGGDEQ